MSVTELKEKAIDVMKGEVTISGLNFVLITAVVLLAGICIGLLTAPFTHGVSICSHNWNNLGIIIEEMKMPRMTGRNVENKKAERQRKEDKL